MDSGLHLNLQSVKQLVAAEDADLSGSTFEQVNLSNATFHDVNLSGSRLDDVNLAGLEIVNANLTGATIRDSATDQMTIDGIAVADLMAAYRAMKREAG